MLSTIIINLQVTKVVFIVLTTLLSALLNFCPTKICSDNMSSSLTQTILYYTTGITFIYLPQLLTL